MHDHEKFLEALYRYNTDDEYENEWTAYDALLGLPTPFSQIEAENDIIMVSQKNHPLLLETLTEIRHRFLFYELELLISDDSAKSSVMVFETMLKTFKEHKDINPIIQESKTLDEIFGNNNDLTWSTILCKKAIVYKEHEYTKNPPKNTELHKQLQPCNNLSSSFHPSNISKHGKTKVIDARNINSDKKPLATPTLSKKQPYISYNSKLISRLTSKMNDSSKLISRLISKMKNPPKDTELYKQPKSYNNLFPAFCPSNISKHGKTKAEVTNNINSDKKSPTTPILSKKQPYTSKLAYKRRQPEGSNTKNRPRTI